MKKEYRVRKNEDFQKIIKKRQSFANKHFVMYSLHNSTHMRVGISVSKKLGNAVVRNKTKRQVRMMVNEIFDENMPYDYVIIVRNQFLVSSYEENKNQLLFLYNKLNKRMDK